VVEPGWFGQIM